MSFDHTRIYLSRVVPWVPGAYVNLHWTVPNKKFDPAKPVSFTNKEVFLNGQAFQTPESVLSHLQYIQTRADTRDIYICMSAQAKAETKSYAGGRPYLAAVRGLDFFAGSKSLYMDLDVKADPTKGYATTGLAFQEFKRFLTETGLPTPTMVVSSGTGGFHIYWVLDRVLDRDEWSPLANALAEASRRHGMVVDTQCTVDAVRLLRPPNTLNRKQGVGLPVMLGANHVQPADISVEHMRNVLSPYLGAKVLTMPGRPGAITGANAELAGGIATAVARPIDIATLEPVCGFVRNAMATGGATYAQPLWNLTTLLASFCMSGTMDGRGLAHKMAVGHPGYTHTDTDALYDRKMGERQTRNIGWPSCRSIENAGCTDCATCPLLSHGKTPLSFGAPYVAPVATIGVSPSPIGLHPGTILAAGPQAAHPAAGAGHLPRNYHVSPTGIISRMSPQPDGTMKMIEVSPYPMHSGWLQSNPWVLHFTTRLGTSVLETAMSMPLPVLQSREYNKHLGAQGYMIGRFQQPELQDFLMAWVQTLQQIKDAVVTSSPFGWSKVNSKMEGFVYASRLWGNGFDKPAATPNPVLEQHYKPHGELQPWKDAADFITGQGRHDLNAIVASALGGPLMEFTGHSGAILSAYSQGTGVGKSSTMTVTQGFWGDPLKAMQGLSDTQNSVINKVGQLKSIPLNWDELKGEDQKQKFVTLAFQVSGGKEKSRLASDSTQKDVGTWKTLVVVAANESLADAVQQQIRTNDAGVMRVFEFEVTPQKAPTHSHGFVSRLIAKTHDNYGQAGLVYAKFLGANYDRINDEVGMLMERLITQLGMPQEERLWTAVMACLILGARYGNELSLVQIDEAGLYKFLVDTLQKLRKTRKHSAADISKPDALSSLLQDFLGEMAARHTLTTDYVPVGRGRPQPIKTMTDISRLEKIVIRHAVSQNLLIISKSAFSGWLQKSGRPPQTVFEQMGKLWNVNISVLRALGTGTELGGAGFREYCIEIDYSGSNFANILDQTPKPVVP